MFKDSGKGSFANMPQEKIQKDWPKYPYGKGKEINDTITGIDDCVSQMTSKKSKNISNQK